MIGHPTLVGTRQLDKALPGMYVDIILNGVPARHARDHRMVWGKCVSIAMSAQRRGWSEMQFTNEVARDESVLWAQLRARRGRRTRSRLSARKDLSTAWEAAAANLRKQRRPNPARLTVDAKWRAVKWSERLSGGTDGLTHAQTAVMVYVVTEMQRRGMLRVTCPGRDVAEFAKVSHQTAVRILKLLTQRGLLIKHYGGRGGATATGRAAIYELVEPHGLPRSTHPPRGTTGVGESTSAAVLDPLCTGRRTSLPDFRASSGRVGSG